MEVTKFDYGMLALIISLISVLCFCVYAILNRNKLKYYFHSYDKDQVIMEMELRKIQRRLDEIGYNSIPSEFTNFFWQEANEEVLKQPQIVAKIDKRTKAYRDSKKNGGSHDNS